MYQEIKKMAEFKPLFTTEDLIKKIKDDPTIRFKCDLAIAYPYAQQTLHNYAEKGVVDLEAIEGALNDNRIKAKKSIVDKWVGSHEFAKQITAYRVMATPEERDAISQGGGAKKQEEQGAATINIVWQRANQEDK